MDNVAAIGEGRAKPYVPKLASPAFKQELRLQQKRFNIELSRRLQTVLRDNRDLDPNSQEFQDIVAKEADYLRKQERFQISYSSQGGYFFGEDTTQQSDYLDKVTIAPGKQTFYGRSATDIFQTARISKAMVDPSVDQIMTPEEINAGTQAILNGESVSKRTNDWAAALGMSPKDLINGQRLERGLPPIDRVKQDTTQTERQYPRCSKDIKNEYEGMQELRSWVFPTVAQPISHQPSFTSQPGTEPVNGVKLLVMELTVMVVSFRGLAGLVTLHDLALLSATSAVETFKHL